MTKTTRILSAVALIGGLSISLAASAQQEGPPGPPPAGGQAGRWDDPAQMRQRFEARRQARLQRLHDALGLRSDQEGAWQAFVASARGPVGERRPGFDRRQDGAARAELTTPARLDRMQQRMAERQARFAQRADAIKRFYAALDPRQQKTFDALVLARFGGGRSGFGHRGPMRG